MGEIEDLNRRRRPVVRLKVMKVRVKEYMHETGAGRGEGFEQAKMECVDKERWRLFCCGHLEGNFYRKQGIINY